MYRLVDELRGEIGDHISAGEVDVQAPRTPEEGPGGAPTLKGP